MDFIQLNNAKLSKTFKCERADLAVALREMGRKGFAVRTAEERFQILRSKMFMHRALEKREERKRKRNRNHTSK